MFSLKFSEYSEEENIVQIIILFVDRFFHLFLYFFFYYFLIRILQINVELKLIIFSKDTS